MDFYVNGNKIDISLENEKTVGEVLKAFEEECAKNKATTVSIFVDDKQITAEDFDEIAKVEIKDSTKIELGVISENDVNEAFANEAKLCRQIAQELEQVPVNLQSGKDKEASIIITRLADLVDNICHTASLSALFPETYGSIKIEDKTFSEYFADLSAILGDFEKALTDKDSVMTGDLAEYEISPRLIALADALEA